ncbi:uncharacterized protein LOC110685147 [Chenopodium quinoa]|uniref:uncharacterized protein LOC110685147 n=1 Tax=Chenopodium quinoa TaxID=63459 RepID=UPI000B794E54|nr:uncharacterized protein LOC110685147 [Chenopodium quinoa]
MLNTGVYTFRAQGSIYHKIGKLLPSTSESRPQFLQLYIYDTEHEVKNRLAENITLRQDIVKRVKAILDQCNPFVHNLRSLAQQENVQDCALRINEQPSDRPQYCLPTASHAVVIVGGEEVANLNLRDILVQSTSGQLMTVLDTAGYYDPLQYPLLFPYGSYGWSINSLDNNGRTIPCRAFYAYIIQVRQCVISIILMAGRLFQQFIIDMFVKIEANKLRWIRDNQNTIRAELYQGLQDCLDVGELNPVNAGKSTILPSSFVGCPRDMNQRFQDAMALVTHYGKPELFLTMTCNPSWREIVDELLPDKPKSPEEYDTFVRAEIPDRDEEPRLYDAVLKHMIHNPCGEGRRNSTYMENGVCKLPLHENSATFVDNGWVVPYNSWLLLKYDCHINVEICSSIKSVKYLYKYVHKGVDRVSMEVPAGAEYNEIQQYVDVRWVCAPEALWRIYQFPITRLCPSVDRLQLHLQD